MSNAETAIVARVVAIYPDHTTVERAVRHLHESGFPLDVLSIVGRDIQETEEPFGLVSRGDYARAGAETGALFGWLIGLCIGAAFLILPGLGLVVVAGPIAASLMAAIEGGVAGASVGSLAGALIAWGVPRHRALKYEPQVKAGKFLILVRSTPETVARARSLLAAKGPEHIEVIEPPAS
jgi:Heat induced stress protein YflT domain